MRICSVAQRVHEHSGIVSPVTPQCFASGEGAPVPPIGASPAILSLRCEPLTVSKVCGGAVGIAVAALDAPVRETGSL